MLKHGVSRHGVMNCRSDRGLRHVGRRFPGRLRPTANLMHPIRSDILATTGCFLHLALHIHLSRCPSIEPSGKGRNMRMILYIRTDVFGKRKIGISVDQAITSSANVEF